MIKLQIFDSIAATNIFFYDSTFDFYYIILFKLCSKPNICLNYLTVSRINVKPSDVRCGKRYLNRFLTPMKELLRAIAVVCSCAHHLVIILADSVIRLCYRCFRDDSLQNVSVPNFSPSYIYIYTYIPTCLSILILEISNSPDLRMNETITKIQCLFVNKKDDFGVDGKLLETSFVVGYLRYVLP